MILSGSGSVPLGCRGRNRLHGPKSDSKNTVAMILQSLTFSLKPNEQEARGYLDQVKKLERLGETISQCRPCLKQNLQREQQDNVETVHQTRRGEKAGLGVGGGGGGEREGAGLSMRTAIGVFLLLLFFLLLLLLLLLL